METGVRELKDHLDRRAVGELILPATHRSRQGSKFDRLVASGVITRPPEDEDPLEGCPEIHLAPGTAAVLIDIDRSEG